MRFAYCACVLASYQNSWPSIDVDKLLAYIQSCRSYDGGFGWSILSESHAGLTYCALGCLKLISDHMKIDLDEYLADKNKLIYFLVSK